MASCLAARDANHRSHEPPPCFAWGDTHGPVRSYYPRGLCHRPQLVGWMPLLLQHLGYLAGARAGGGGGGAARRRRLWW